MRIISLFSIILISLAACGEGKAKSPCKGRQWKNTQERLDCLYPYPPVGRWHAVYTEEFAKSNNLPLENVSKDLSPGIDYMEMDVQNYGDKGGVACMANMLVKKPHDIALFNLEDIEPKAYFKNRKLLHHINIEEHQGRLKSTTTFNSASRDYKLSKQGFRKTTFAMYASDVIEGYDYISANMHCRNVSMKPQYFPDGYALWVHKASIWGRYETPFGNYDNPSTPKGMDFYNSLFFINVPHELISKVFEDVPLGGQ